MKELNFISGYLVTIIFIITVILMYENLVGYYSHFISFFWGFFVSIFWISKYVIDRKK